MSVNGYSKAYTDANFAPIGSVASGLPGAIYFDSYFSGSTDDQKIAAMNTYNASFSAGQSGNAFRPVILFGARAYSFSTAIQMYTGMALLGTRLVGAHGVNIQTKFNWGGAAGTSMLAFPGTQTGQGYPSDGSPRDMWFESILFNGPSNTHFIENHNPATDSSTGRVIWYSRFRNCAWTNFQTIHWGWIDGCSYDGQLDISQIGSTAFYLSGAESVLFGRETYSQADSTVDTGVPFIRSRLENSLIGWCLYTGRGAGTGLTIEAGKALVVDGFNIDAQASQPIYGAGMHITGGDGITITNTLFRCMANAPGSAAGGTATNRGYVDIAGGSQITFLGNTFVIDGNTPPATTYPLIYATGVGAGQVKFGYNNWSGYNGASATIKQSTSGLITYTADPNLTVAVG